MTTRYTLAALEVTPRAYLEDEYLEYCRVTRRLYDWPFGLGKCLLSYLSRPEA
jgi:hypothetical protein